MNREIAQSESWGETEIEARGRRIAELAIKIWPGPDPNGGAAQPNDWALLARALIYVPAGKWVDLGSLIGLVGKRPPEAVAHLRAVKPTNWHRVLGTEGDLLDSKSAPKHADVQRRLLEVEGIRFDGDGKADRTQRLRGGVVERALGYGLPSAAVRTTLVKPGAKAKAVRVKPSAANRRGSQKRR